MTRRIKKSLYGGDLHSSHILLFSSKNGMLRERVSLAADLWGDNLPCRYMHPPNLTHATLKRYAKDHMIRWLVLFKKNEFREKSHVQVIDLQATGSTSQRSSDRSGGGSGGDNGGGFMPINEVNGFIRARMAGKRDAELASLVSSASSSGAGSLSSAHPGAGHAHLHQHSKPSYLCHIIDAVNIKSSVKNQILTQVKRCLSTVLATANPATFAVTAVDLPFTLVRNITTAFYAGPAQMQVALEESHAKQRILCDQLVAHMMKKCGGGQHLDPYAAATSSSSSKSSKEKEKAAAAAALAAAETAKQRVEVLYIYSIPDKKADMILCT